MAKRRKSGDHGDSDDSDVERTPSKRARVDDDILEEESEDQRKFEAKFGDLVRASIENRVRTQAKAAESGIIQSLELHNFMCHPRLTFKFGPQINFIIGHNGSGKSAVLSAITVALGGKATTTGRGSGLRSFIKEGQTWSEVSITLKNEGEDAYKHHIYGDSIVVTRRFTKEGTSSYKIKTSEGKTISTKREELSAICDHMNIQVDNPMSILTQDNARHFLSASHSSDKYEFFLKGTQLKQLSEEYETCLENVGKTYDVLEAKKQVLPDLKRAVKDALTRWKGARKAVEQKEKMAELRKELAWSHVKGKEDELKAKIEEVAKETRKLPRIEVRLEETKAQLEEANQKIVALENELEQLGDIEHLSERKLAIQDRLRENRNELQRFKNQTKEMNDELKRCNKAIESFTMQIAEETKKLQQDKQAEREERERKLTEAQKGIEDHQEMLKAVNEQLRQENDRRENLQKSIADAEQEQRRAHEHMQRCSSQIDQLNMQARDNLTAFGRNIPEFLERIKREQWHGQLPKGPLGMYVSLNNQKYADIMRGQLGTLVRSFAITDPRDRNTLRRILTDTQNQQMQIIVAEVDLFDYSSGEPPEQYQTALRALTFKDEYVKRIFINQNRLERIFLADYRKEGEALLDSVPGGGMAWTVDGFRVQAYGDGGYYTTVLPKIDPRDSRSMLFINSDPAIEKARWRDEGKRADDEYKRQATALSGYKADFRTCQDNFTRLTTEAKRLDGRIRDFKQAHATLINQYNEDIPVNISAFETAKKEVEDNKASVIAQFKDLEIRKAAVDAEQHPLLSEMEQVKAQIEEFDQKRSIVADKVLKATDDRVKAQHEANSYQQKLADAQKKIEALDTVAKTLQEEYEEWSKKAEDLCDGDRVDNPRKTEEVKRAFKSVEKALQEQQREQGATVEELEAELVEVQQKYAATERDLRDLTNLNKVLKQSLLTRLERWHCFRRHIALVTKIQFQYHLSKRAYFGKVLFDHYKQKLDLKVQTDDQAQTQGLNKDPKSLSGGEKSFSTICLLLALWEAIGCPLRCLDEFDVFMDAVNRRVSMGMMIETANASDSKQYILITPQDMSNVSFGPSVKINRMPDPERGQGTIRF